MSHETTLATKKMGFFSDKNPVEVSTTAITHMLYEWSKPGRVIYLADTKQPFYRKIQNKDLYKSFDEAKIHPVEFGVHMTSLADSPKDRTALVNPNFVNYVLAQDSVYEPLAVHIHGNKMMTTTAYRPETILSKFIDAGIDLVAVPLLNGQGTAHVVASRVKTLTEAGSAPLSECMRSDLQCVLSKKSDGGDPNRFLIPYTPRIEIEFFDGSRIAAPLRWDRRAITNPGQLKAASPAP